MQSCALGLIENENRTCIAMVVQDLKLPKVSTGNTRVVVAPLMFVVVGEGARAIENSVSAPLRAFNVNLTRAQVIGDWVHGGRGEKFVVVHLDITIDNSYFATLREARTGEAMRKLIWVPKTEMFNMSGTFTYTNVATSYLYAVAASLSSDASKIFV